MITLDPTRTLDAKKVQPDLEDLIEATCSLIDREWPTQYAQLGTAHILQYTRMRLVQTTYFSILWLTAGVEKDPRRKMLVISAAPLVRTLFEELLTLIYLFHEFPTLILQFERTGYYDLFREVAHAECFHGNDSEWKSYLAKQRTQLDRQASKLQLSVDEISNPKKWIGEWPTPGKMISKVKKDYPNSKSIPFMEFLYSWLYRTLSEDSHLGFHGLIRRGSHFAKKALTHKFGDKTDEKMKEAYDTYRMEMVWTTFTLVLAICTEINAHFGFDRAAKIESLWQIMIKHSDLSKQFYDRRYIHINLVS